MIVLTRSISVLKNDAVTWLLLFLLLLFLSRMLPASIHVEAALHQREKKNVYVDAKGKCPSSREKEREREELTGAPGGRAAPGISG